MMSVKVWANQDRCCCHRGGFQFVQPEKSNCRKLIKKTAGTLLLWGFKVMWHGDFPQWLMTLNAPNDTVEGCLLILVCPFLLPVGLSVPDDRLTNLPKSYKKHSTPLSFPHQNFNFSHHCCHHIEYEKNGLVGGAGFFQVSLAGESIRLDVSGTSGVMMGFQSRIYEQGIFIFLL